MWVSPWKLRIPGACTKIDLAARNVRVFDVLVKVERQGVEREMGRVGNSREKGEGILKKKGLLSFPFRAFLPISPPSPRPTFIALLQ